MTDLASIIAAHAPIHAGQDCDGDGWVDCRCMKLADAPVEEWIAHVVAAVQAKFRLIPLDDVFASGGQLRQMGPRPTLSTSHGYVTPPESVVVEVELPAWMRRRNPEVQS